MLRWTPFGARQERIDRMRHRALVTVLTCGLALSATACGGAAQVSNPTPPAPTSIGVALPYAGAPNVANPLDGTPLVNDGCSAMTLTQASQILGGTIKRTVPNSGTIMTAGGETGCGWDLNEGLGGVVAGPTVHNPYGLSGTYKASQSAVAAGKQPTFKEMAPVEGYPTIQYTEGFQGNGVCITDTGISNSQDYIVKVDLSERNPNYADPCGLGAKVAALAIKKLKGE